MPENCHSQVIGKDIVQIILIVFIFLSVGSLSVLFFAQNDQLVTFNFLIGQSDISLAYIIIVSICIGFLLGILSLLSLVISQKLKIRASEKKVKQLSKELENLRSLPIRDEF